MKERKIIFTNNKTAEKGVILQNILENMFRLKDVS
jgi:hypothetical protein